MDKLIYTAGSGLKHVLTKQATVSNNIANASTTGFKSQLDRFKSAPILDAKLNTRTFVVDSTVGTDFSKGAHVETGKVTDMAINGDGFFAIQMPDGSEAYTRNGSFKISPTGMLVTQNDLPVLSDGGPIAIPQDTKLSIGPDGTISTVNNFYAPGPNNTLARIKVVNPDLKNVQRAENGYFLPKDGKPFTADASARVVSGFYESSNVNVVNEMVDMISLGRQFDLNMKLIQSAKENEDKANVLLNFN